MTTTATMDNGLTLDDFAPGRYRVTYATLICTGATRATYGVYRGALLVVPQGGRKEAQIELNVSGCDLVQCYSVDRPISGADYLEMAARHATPVAPAFFWHVEEAD